MNRISLPFLVLLIVAMLLGCSANSVANSGNSVISSVSPSQVVAGGAGFNLAVYGSGFVGNAVVLWNGSARATQFISKTQLQASISSADIQQAGSAQVTVSDQRGNAVPSNTALVTIQGSLPLGVATSSLPAGELAGSYSATLTAKGGSPPYKWGLASGSLPPGLLLSSSTGAVTGTPTGSGQYSFTVQVQDSQASPQTATGALGISVASPLQIKTTSLPSGQVQTSYQATVAATGGITPYNWSVILGSLPPGLAVSASTGAISGKPTASGQYSFTLQAQDSAASTQIAISTFNISIAAAAATAPQITTSALANGTTQLAYSATLTATGGTPPYSWSVISGSLPPGLTLGALTGAITGTPTASGQYSFTLQAQDSAASPQTVSKQFGISVGTSAPQITTSTLPNGILQTAYSATLAATGGTPPYSWSVASGSLPTGMLLASSGQISGTPAQTGSFSFTAQVRDSSSTAQSVTKNLAIAVGAATTPLQITTSSLPAGQVSANYSATLAASGGTPPYAWSIASGSLPPGLTLQASLGSINGTPSQSGTFSITMLAKDSSASPQTAMNTYSVIIGSVATGTPITSCQTLATSGTTYVLQNDVTSIDSCFNVAADDISINLNGHSITYGNTPTPPTMAVFGVYGAASWDPNFASGGLAAGNATGGSWNNLTIAGPGTITQGNCLDVSNDSIGSNAIHLGQGAGDGLSVFAVTFNICGDSTQAIFSDANGAGFSVHDNIVNNKVVTAQKRSVFQGVAFVCDSCGSDNGASSSFFNNTIIGGPQGCIMWNNPNTNLYNNVCSQGNPNAVFSTLSTSLVCESTPYINATGTLPVNPGTQCTNDFGLYARGKGASLFGNTVTPLEGRGIFVGASSGASVHDNVVNAAQEFPNNSEYGGCEIGGAYGIQFDDNGTNEVAYNNTVTAISSPCSASALRVTDSETYSNVSHNNMYIAKRAPGSPSTCTGFINNQENCAYGVSFDGTTAGVPLQFTSDHDSFTADSAIMFFDWDGPTNQALFISPTFSKGSNADSNFFHFAVFRNGNGAVNVHVRDALFGSGISPTDTVLPAQGPNNKAVSLYIDWTITLTVQNQSGSPISGASVAYSNAMSNQECTAITDSTGTANCILTQYRLNNDTGANQIESHNPFSFTISAPGCTTSTGQESVIAPVSEIKQLSGC
jgi:hypothetical protein